MGGFSSGCMGVGGYLGNWEYEDIWPRRERKLGGFGRSDELRFLDLCHGRCGEIQSHT